MFGFFKKKEKGPTIVNKVWLNTEQKWNSCLKLLKQQPNTLFVVWFDESYKALNSFLAINGHPSKVVMYRQATTAHAADYVFAEHYPLPSKEMELFKQLGLQTIVILNALDEPFFQQFGGDRIAALMEKMGMKEDEEIEHALISNSIKNAQEKLATKVMIEQSANSQQEWFHKNMIA